MQGRPPANASMDELLSGQFLKQRVETQQQQEGQSSLEQMRQLKQNILEAITDDFLRPLNTPSTIIKGQLKACDLTGTRYVAFCRVQYPWDTPVAPTVSFMLTATPPPYGMEEEIIFKEKSTEPYAPRFVYQKNGDEEDITIQSRALKQLFNQAEFLYHQRPDHPLPQPDKEGLTIYSSGGKITIKVPQQKYVRTAMQDLLNREGADFAKLFQMAALVKRKYGIDKWVREHQQEIETRYAAQKNEP